MRNRDDNIPLLVETEDYNPAYRREGTVVYSRRDNRIHAKLSPGMLRIFIGLICIFFTSIVLIVLANSSITSKLDKLKTGPSTKSYFMPTEKLTRKVFIRTTKKEFLQRFTTKTTKMTTKLESTRRPTTILAKINGPEISTFKGVWQCGTAAISQQVTREMIERDCPKLLEAVNSCCIVHDQCYDEQLGQQDCDSGFCKCLSSVTITTENSTSKCHNDHSPWFCEMVKAFGDTFYTNAGLNTTLHSGLVDIFGEPARNNKTGRQ